MDATHFNIECVREAYERACTTLLAQLRPEGYWEGALSPSALSTATAVTALHLTGAHPSLIEGGLRWLVAHQNADGGWGDTVKSISNISTTMLCRAAFHVTGAMTTHAETLRRCDEWLVPHGRTPTELAEAIRARYGKDRTFSVPILMMSALAGLVPWHEVPRLPFELAALPQSWYRFARLPVVSYALPALIAIGQVIHHHRGTWNPLTALCRWLTRRRTFKVLQRIQPSSGGYLEATPLTSFVVMSLATIACQKTLPESAQRVQEQGCKFLVNSVLPDGSWAIDSNLSIWVTTLAINALAGADDLAALPDSALTAKWLLTQQTTTQHPFTGAAPGSWGWSHLPGSVPDCDDTPGAILALTAIAPSEHTALANGVEWVLNLQNRDGGWPTFCRGWGKLPFDRSGADLTAHALRVIHRLGNQLPKHLQHRLPSATLKGFAYLARQQADDGSWLPLWFGNQHAPDDINPVYGTVKVLAAYRDLKQIDRAECQRGIAFLLQVQNADGGWGGAAHTPSSVEETALVVEVLSELVPNNPAVRRGVRYLVERVEANTFADPTPIGFYFAKLWYFEALYPVVFTVAALGKALRLCQ